MPQWKDDWSKCAVDVPDSACHWYVTVSYTHPHEVSSPVGYRYTINTWVTDGTCKASIVNPEEGRRIMEELNEK